MNHCTDNEGHETEKRCTFQHQYQNKVFLCKVKKTVLAILHQYVDISTAEEKI